MTPSHHTVIVTVSDSRWWFASFACICTVYTNMNILHMDIQWHDDAVDAVAATIDFTYQTYISKHRHRHLTSRHANTRSIHIAKVLKWIPKAFSKSTVTNQFDSLEILQRSYNQKAILSIWRIDSIFIKFPFFIFTYRIWGTPNNKCEKSAVESVVLCFTTGWTNLHSLLQRRTFGKWTC